MDNHTKSYGFRQIATVLLGGVQLDLYLRAKQGECRPCYVVSVNIALGKKK